MIAIELKKSILLAAISGKLTFQNENENAQEIFKTNEIITADFPFDIPQNWVWTKVKFIGNVVGGGTPKTNESRFWGGEIPWITPADMSNIHGRYVSNGKRSITSLGLEKSSARLLPQNSVIFSSRAPIGYCAIAKNPLATNQGFKSVIPFNSQMSDYVYYYFLAYADEIAKLGSGTTFKEISGETVKNIYISIPPLAEQKRIVEKLDTLLPLIDSLEKDEIRLKELMQQFPESIKASILQAAIQGSLTNQLLEDGNASFEFEKYIQVYPMKYPDTPFEIPDNWIFEKLGNFVSVITGTSYNSGDLVLDGIRILRGGNVIDKIHSVQFKPDDIFISTDMFDITKQPKENDIVIVASTGSKTVIGKPAFVDQDMDNVQIGAFLRIIRPKYSKYAEYLRLIFMSKYYRNHITNTTQGTNINNISKKHLEDLLIPIPPLSEQKRIIEKVKQILPIVETISTKTN